MSAHAPRPVGPGATPAGGAQPPAPPTCHPPRNTVRTVVIGGGASYAPGLGAPSPDRLAQAARNACPAHAGHRPPPTGATPVDPALAALGSLLGSAAPPPQPPSLAQQVAGRLLMLFAALRPSSGDAAVRGGGPEAAVIDARPAADAPVATPVPPRAPQQPPAPVLTIDPSLGTIVSTDPDGQVPLGATPSPGGGDDGRAPLLPSSWVPVATGALRDLGDRGRAGILRLVSRLDDWLDEVGMSRLGLLALTVLAPAAVVYLISVVWSLLAGS